MLLGGSLPARHEGVEVKESPFIISIVGLAWYGCIFLDSPLAETLLRNTTEKGDIGGSFTKSTLVFGTII